MLPIDFWASSADSSVNSSVSERMFSFFSFFLLWPSLYKHYAIVSQTKLSCIYNMIIAILYICKYSIYEYYGIEIAIFNTFPVSVRVCVGFEPRPSASMHATTPFEHQPPHQLPGFIAIVCHCPLCRIGPLYPTVPSDGLTGLC